MLIRCEKCTTTYELDEALLPPQGAPVQCSRCQFVFTARPQQAAAPTTTRERDALTPDLTPAGKEGWPTPTAASTPPPTPDPSAPSAAPPQATRGRRASTATPAATTTPAVIATPTTAATSTATSTPTSTPTLTQKFTADGRPIRKVTMTDEEPVVSGPRPMITRAATGAPVGPIRRSGIPWLPLLVAALAVGAVVLGWRAWSRRSDPLAARRSGEGQALVLRDDRRSLTEAVVAFDDAARLDDGSVDRRAERVAARALLIGLVGGEASRIEARLAAKQAEKARGSVDVGRADEQVAALRGQRETALAQVRELEAVASGELAPLLRHDAERPPVQRARALLDAFGSDPSRAAQAVVRDRPARGRDPWIDLAVGAGETRAVSPELRAEGVARLEQIVKAHPEILRARLVLAEALARAGRVEAALASLDALLAANKAHADARALRDELVAPSAVHPGKDEALLDGMPAPGAATPQPRNESSHPPAAPPR